MNDDITTHDSRACVCVACCQRRADTDSSAANTSSASLAIAAITVASIPLGWMGGLGMNWVLSLVGLPKMVFMPAFLAVAVPIGWLFEETFKKQRWILGTVMMPCLLVVLGVVLSLNPDYWLNPYRLDAGLFESGISLEQYEQISEGMSYTDVREALGRDGVEVGQTILLNQRANTYMWRNDSGATVTAVFVRDQLVSSEAVGLVRRGTSISQAISEIRRMYANRPPSERGPNWSGLGDILGLVVILGITFILHRVATRPKK